MGRGARDLIEVLLSCIAPRPIALQWWVAARKGADTMVERHVFSGDRDAVRLQAVEAALDLLVRRLA